MVNLLRGILGVCVANALLLAAIVGILTARRSKKDPPDGGGGLNVTRRHGRLYVVITDDAPKRERREPYDWAKESDRDADGKEG